MTLPVSRAPPDVSPEPGLLGLLERATGAGTWAMVLATRRMTWTQPLLRLLGVPPGHAPARDDPLHFYSIEFHDADGGGARRLRAGWRAV
jgi:hypothetical protein